MTARVVATEAEAPRRSEGKVAKVTCVAAQNNLVNAWELLCEDSPDRREGVREDVPQFAHDSIEDSLGGARLAARRRHGGKSHGAPWRATRVSLDDGGRTYFCFWAFCLRVKK